MRRSSWEMNREDRSKLISKVPHTWLMGVLVRTSERFDQLSRRIAPLELVGPSIHCDNMLTTIVITALLGAVSAQYPTQNSTQSSLPTVDLGYETYRATGFNVRTPIYCSSSASNGDKASLNTLGLMCTKYLGCFETSPHCAPQC